MAALAPDVYWLDSSELGAAAWQLGIAHPPGHPLAALVGKAATLLPFGTVAFKVGLASAVCGALAAAQTAALGRWVAARVRQTLAPAAASTSLLSALPPTLPPTLPIDAWLGAAAGLTFGFSYAAGFQAVRPEVYALSALLVISAALALARFDATGDRRHLYLGALWAGLALSNHHLLALAVVVPGLVFAAARRPAGRVAPAVAWVAVAGTLGLVLYAYLPLRAAHAPLVDWGAPVTWPRLYWTVSAQAFQKAVARGSTGDVPGVAFAIAAQLHVATLLALAGLYVLLRLPRLRRLGLFLGGAALCDAAMPAVVGFDPANPDAYGYLSAAVALFAVCAVALPAALAVRQPRLGRLVAAGLAAGALAAGLVAWPQISLRRHGETRAVLAAWLDPAPSRALAITSYFQTVFGLFYLRSVEGARPDVDLVHRHFLAYPGYGEDVLRRTPALAPVLAGRDVDPAALFATGRPLVIEYDLDLPLALVPAASLPLPPELVRHGDLELQTRRFLGWQAYLSAHRACGTPAFSRALGIARELLGAAPELDALAGRCAG